MLVCASPLVAQIACKMNNHKQDQKNALSLSSLLAQSNTTGDAVGVPTSAPISSLCEAVA